MRVIRCIRLAAAGTLTAGAVTVGAAVSWAGAATTTPGPTFAPPVQLTGASGGEPSIVADGSGNVVVSGPQGIPSGVNGIPGVAVWRSSDAGQTFSTAARVGSYLGGGDSDLTMTPSGSLYLADLEAVGSAVCKSTDHANSWSSIGPAPAPCDGAVVGQAGPSADRPWLTADGDQHLYLTYHEFVSAQPVIFRDDNAGSDMFLDGPCGPIVTDPTIEANVPQDVTGGTLVSKPVVDSHGTLYIMFTTTTQQQNTAAISGGQPSGSFSQIYMAVSKDHCSSFTDHVVYDGSKLGTNSVQFGDIFNSLAIDGSGNLYAAAAGFVGTTSFPPVARLYLLSSTDGGSNWTTPKLLMPATEADMMPSAVAGPQPGQLAIGYFRTVNGVTNPNDSSGQWTYEAAVSNDATSGADFVSVPVSTNADGSPFVFHNGDICNQGILCGLVPGSSGGDRSLADFTSATLDPTGCPVFVFAGNPSGTPGNNGPGNTSNYVSRQTSDCF